jgi:hypothetical protein
MPTDEKTPKTREVRFPIRQFSKLLDTFLERKDFELSDSDSIELLKTEVDNALLKAYKS